MARERIIGCLIAVGLASVTGCRGGVLQSDDAAAHTPADAATGADMPHSIIKAPTFGCGGEVDVRGYGPERSPFTATAVDVFVAGDIPPRCERKVGFRLVDSNDAATILFDLPVALADGGPLVPGRRTVPALYWTTTASGAIDTQASVTAEILIGAVEPPPFEACEATGGAPGTAVTGSIDLSISIVQDNFDIVGHILSTYCSCKYCYDTLALTGPGSAR